MKLDNAKPKVGNGDRVKMEDLIDIQQFPDKKWLSVRLLDADILPCRRHWINIIGGKSKKEVKIPKVCVSFDVNTEEDMKGVTCPYCAIAGNETFYLVNAIIRGEQENKPKKAKSPTKAEAKTGFKDPDSETWTPVRVLRIPSSLMQKIMALKDLNKAKNKKTQKM